jgi:hypothetical protein
MNSIGQNSWGGRGEGDVGSSGSRCKGPEVGMQGKPVSRAEWTGRMLERAEGGRTRCPALSPGCWLQERSSSDAQKAPLAGPWRVHLPRVGTEAESSRRGTQTGGCLGSISQTRS